MKKHQTIPEKIWGFFCSVKLAIYTLVLLAATSIIGTVILQNGSEQEYLRLYGEVFYSLIKALNLDDMYHSWWFLSLIVILCINIIVCSIEKLSITWKIIFPKQIKFNPERFRKLKNLQTFKKDENCNSLAEKYETFLSQKIGKPIKKDTDTGIVMYAEKGRWTRIGVYVIHTSIILLIIGALIGGLFGFKASLNLDEGETSDTAFMYSKQQPVKFGFSIRCNEFEVKFYDTGAPEEFRSNLTIIENGKESFTKDILVNHPLRYKGINIFQSSYGTGRPDSALIEIVNLSDQTNILKSIKIGEEIQLPDGSGTFKLEGYLPFFDFRGNNLGPAFIGRITQKDGNGFQVGLPVKFPTFDKMRKGAFAFVVKDFEKKYYTGLQITKDPGIWYVYTGFILIIIGCWITFFMSHQSYFIEIKKDKSNGSKISVSGTSNRNPQGLKLKVKQLVRKLKDI